MYANGISLPQGDICKMVAASPAPRFYIEPRKAVEHYKKYRDGVSKIRHPMKRKMYAEIFARYEAIMSQISKNNRHYFRIIVFEQVLKQPAPCFYLEENSAVKYYYKILYEKRLYNNI